MASHLEIENRALRSQLKALTAEASKNEALLNKFLERELALLSCGSLGELLVSVTEGLKHSFSLDHIRLILNDPQSLIRELLQHNNISEDIYPDISFVSSQEEVACHVGDMHKPLLGPCLPDRHSKITDVCQSKSVAILPLNLRNKLIGCIAMGSNDAKRFTPDHATDFLERLAAIVSVCLENAINRESIILSGLTDALTGFYNRAYLERRLSEEISRAARYRQPLSCLFLDIDYFKRVNDTYGHANGDRVLQEVANRIKSQLRGSDIPTRFGGEEFTLLLPQTASEEALQLAERIRLYIQASPIHLADHAPLNVTISVGVSQLLAHQHQKLTGLGAQLLHEADNALYEAKENGRNRAVLASPRH